MIDSFSKHTLVIFGIKDNIDLILAEAKSFNVFLLPISFSHHREYNKPRNSLSLNQKVFFYDCFWPMFLNMCMCTCQCTHLFQFLKNKHHPHVWFPMDKLCSDRWLIYSTVFCLGKVKLCTYIFERPKNSGEKSFNISVLFIIRYTYFSIPY